MCTAINEAKKEYLRRYLTAQKRYREIQREIEVLEGRYIMPSKKYDGMPHGKGGNSDLSSFGAKYDELMTHLKEMRDECNQTQMDVSRTIEKSACTDTEKVILRYRYIRGYTWEMIAVELDLSYQWVCELHGRALRMISLDSN